MREVDLASRLVFESSQGGERIFRSWRRCGRHGRAGHPSRQADAERPACRDPRSTVYQPPPPASPFATGAGELLADWGGAELVLSVQAATKAAKAPETRARRRRVALVRFMVRPADHIRSGSRRPKWPEGSSGRQTRSSGARTQGSGASSGSTWSVACSMPNLSCSSLHVPLKNVGCMALAGMTRCAVSAVSVVLIAQT